MKIGIVGLGFMGAAHLKAYSNLADVKIGAVCSRNERALSGDLSDVGGNLAGAAAVYDFSSVEKYKQWQELVKDADLEAVDICAPTDLHAPIAIGALTAGKHVFCEKPMALSLTDCDRMAAAAKQHNRVLMIGQVLRFWPEYEYASDFVKSGRYGRVLSATFTRRCGLPDWSAWLPDEARSGGAVIDLLIHDIDQVLELFGMPNRVAAKKLGDVDALTATFIYPNGPDVRIQGGWFPPGTPLSMSFQVRAERAELDFGPAGLKLNDGAGNMKNIEVAGESAYQKELAYFVDCCESDRLPARCPPEDSAMAVKLALLLKESRAKEGEQVPCSA